MNLWISQVVGALAFSIFIMSIQQKDKRKILFWQIIAFFLYAVQYFFIKAYPGMITYIINMIRSILFYRCAQINKNSKTALIIIIIVSLGCGVFTYKNIYDFLPIIASVLSTFFTWQSNIKVLKFGQIFVCTLWIIYDIFVLAYIGIFTEMLVIFSSIFSLLSMKYNIDFSKIILKYYIKIKFKAEDEIINFSPHLPEKRLIKRLNIK